MSDITARDQELNACYQRIAELEEALQFKRNVIIHDGSIPKFKGDWIAVPQEDFVHARKVLDND